VLLLGRVRALVAIVLVAGCTASPAVVAPSPTQSATSTPAPTIATTPTVPTDAPAPSDDGAPSIYDESADPQADIDRALAAAREDGKRVLLDFGADWCPDCHVLASYLETEEGEAILERSFHIVSIDVGFWDHNLDVVERYGDAIWSGIPALVALDGDGNVVAKLDKGEVASASGMSKEQVLEQVASLAE